MRTGLILLLAVTGTLLVDVAAPADAKSRGPRRDSVTEIIVHATGGPFCERGQLRFSPAGDLDRMQRFFAASAQVSIHYIVAPDGAVAASVPENETAFHARDRNETSIGIELINAGDGREPYTEAQLDALATLVHGIRTRWQIPLAEIKGHEQVDHSTFQCAGRTHRRKQDPGPLFPWDRFHLDLLVAETDRPLAAGR